jgi:hypothetical protein
MINLLLAISTSADDLYPVLYMRAVLVGSNYNFQLMGSQTPDFAVSYGFANGGFMTLFQVGGSSAYIYQMQPSELSGLIVSMSVTAIGPPAIIQFTITNTQHYAQNVSVSLYADIMVGGYDSAPCYDLGNGDGFQSVGGLVEFTFHARHHPLSTDADTYWFGNYGSRLSNLWNQVTDTSYAGDSAMSISWKNRTVPGGGRIVLTTVVTGGIGSSVPTLDLSSTIIPSSIDWMDFLTISGRAIDPDGDGVTIFAVFEIGRAHV